MIVRDLHRQPVPLDSQTHRTATLRLPIADWRFASALNAVFVTAHEIAALARDYPIVFVHVGAGEDGQPDYAPVAVLGLKPGENLYVGADGRWRAPQLPAQLALYPLCVARVDAERYAVCVDASAPMLQQADGGDGERLFGDDGGASAFLQARQSTLETIEQHVEETRAIGRRLAALGLLGERRFDATLPDGRQLAVDGFLTVDRERVNALDDATVLALHREGLLGLIHAHWIALGQMGRLAEWRFERDAAAATGGDGGAGGAAAANGTDGEGAANGAAG